MCGLAHAVRNGLDADACPPTTARGGSASSPSAKDAALRAVEGRRHVERTWRSFPLVAHWLDGEPLDDGEVAIMAKIEDRHRVVRRRRRAGRDRCARASPTRGRARTRRSGAACRSASCTRSRCATSCASRRSTTVLGLAKRLARRSRWQTVEPWYRAHAERSTGTASPRSTPASRASRTSRAIRSARHDQGAGVRRRRRTPTCCARSSRSSACSTVPDEVLAAPGHVREGRRARRRLARRAECSGRPATSCSPSSPDEGSRHADRYRAA